MLMMPPNVTGPCSLDQKFLMMSILWVSGRPAYGISSSRYNAKESVFVRYLNISIWSLWSYINYQLCCIYNRWMTHQSMILITCYLNRRQVDNWGSETVSHEIETSYAYTKNGLLVHICYIYILILLILLSSLRYFSLILMSRYLMVNLPITECLYDDMASFANLLPHTLFITLLLLINLILMYCNALVCIGCWCKRSSLHFVGYRNHRSDWPRCKAHSSWYAFFLWWF